MRWVIGAAVVLIVLFVFDWLLVMGADPRKWKGGDKDDFDRFDG